MLNNWFFALFMSHRWSEQVKQCNGIKHTLVVESAVLSSGLCISVDVETQTHSCNAFDVCCIRA